MSKKTHNVKQGTQRNFSIGFIEWTRMVATNGIIYFEEVVASALSEGGN